jgi:flagellar basal body-associated protein FliL
MEMNMKRIIIPVSKGWLIVYRIGVVLILALAVVLVTGSLYAVFRSPDSGPLFRIGGGGERVGQEPAAAGAVNVFSGVGRLRIPLAGEQAATIILSISFPYPADDRAFAEELASRIGDFRSIASLYFASLPPEKAADLDEEAAKAAILERYNALLRLGRIETLYFGDLMIVD